MRIRKHFSLALLSLVALLALVIHEACNKRDYSKEGGQVVDPLVKFFTIKASTDPVVVAIAASVKRQNSKRHFVSKLVKTAGFPVWDKAKVMTRDNKGTQVFIPFVMDDQKQTKAILMARITSVDTFYHLLYAAEYKKYGFGDNPTKGSWTARQVFTAFTLFDREIFNHSEFIVTDSRIYKSGVKDATPTVVRFDNTTTQANQSKIWYVTQVATYIICHECSGMKQSDAARGSSLMGDCCNPEYFSGYLTWWFDDIENDYGWFVPEGGPGGGGGGGGYDPCPGCSWDEHNPCDDDPEAPHTEICDENWHPTPHLEFDPLACDSIGVDPSLLDSGFVCLYNLLRHDFSAMSQMAQMSLFHTFGTSRKVNIYYKMDWSADSSSGYIMQTDPAHLTYNQPLGLMLKFYDTVKMNPYFMRHASKEAIIGSIIHEGIHGYIYWCIASYQFGLNGVDSNYLKAHFPFDWDWFNHRPYDHQHDIMVNDYITQIVDAVDYLGNQSVSQDLRRWIGTAVAYSALDESPIWKILPDTCLIRGTNFWVQHPDMRNYSFNPPCGSYPVAFKDSLQLLGPLCH